VHQNLSRLGQRAVATTILGLVTGLNTDVPRSRISRAAALALMKATELMRSMARAPRADGGGAALVGAFLEEWEWHRSVTSIDLLKTVFSAQCLMHTVSGGNYDESATTHVGAPVARTVLTLWQLCADFEAFTKGHRAVLETCPISSNNRGVSLQKSSETSNGALCYCEVLGPCLIIVERSSVLITGPFESDKVLRSAALWSTTVAINRADPGILHLAAPANPGGKHESAWDLKFRFGEDKECVRVAKLLEARRGEELERVLAELDTFLDCILRQALASTRRRSRTTSDAEDTFVSGLLV